MDLLNTYFLQCNQMFYNIKSEIAYLEDYRHHNLFNHTMDVNFAIKCNCISVSIVVYLIFYR